jgi:hypothetical protein
MVTPPLVPRLIGYAAAFVAAYAAGIGFVMLFVAEPSLVDIVSACKMISLLALIYANRELPERVDVGRHAEIWALNTAIVLASCAVLLLMVLKVVVDDYAMLTLAPRGQALLGWFVANAYWVSTLPIFCYFALDLMLAFRPGACPEDRRAAVEFLVFRDLVCAAPLALVLGLTEAFVALSPRQDAAASAELFFSGALTVILLASTIAAKALNLVQERRSHEAAVARTSAVRAPMRLRDAR